jgi:hypothetical protein
MEQNSTFCNMNHKTFIVNYLRPECGSRNSLDFEPAPVANFGRNEPHRLALLCVLVAASIPSCAPMSNDNATAAGTATGAAGGALLGGLAGRQSGHGAEGALVGGLGGAMLGQQNGVRWFGGDGSIQSVTR